MGDTAVICSTCKEQGRKSTIRITQYNDWDFKNVDSYYDEDGIWHSHDKNIIQQTWTCSNGHSVVQTGTLAPCIYNKCSWGRAPLSPTVARSTSASAPAPPPPALPPIPMAPPPPAPRS